METVYLPSKLDPAATDVLLMVGSDNYNVPAYIAEAETYGASKRISINSLVQGLVPGISNLYIWHREAIPFVTNPEYSWGDLVTELADLGLLDNDVVAAEDLDWGPTKLLLPADFVPAGTLQVTCAIQRNPVARRELEDKYAIRWQGGVILYTVLGKLRFILKDGETELPDNLKPYAHMIEAVRVRRVNDDGDGHAYDE